MRHLLIAACAAGTLATSAFAADMPVKAPALAPTPAYNWTGFYVNGGFGYGMWTADTTTFNPVTGNCVLCVEQRQGGRGWLGTAGAGFDYQFAPRIVGGVFGDADFGSISGTIQDQTPLFAGTTKEKWAWAAGARAGWIPTAGYLTYINGGFTQAHFTSANMQATGGGASLFSTPDITHNGWFIGGGVERALWPGWSLRTEYRYADYRSVTLTDTAPGGSQQNINFHPIVQTIRSEIVYKFGGGMLGLPNNAGPLPPAPRMNWTGFYLNAGFGYGMWTADTTTVNPATGICTLCVEQRQGGRGWLGTLGGGFDYQLQQINPHMVVGAFADVDFSSLSGTIQDQNPFFAGTLKEDWAWSAGARAGWLVTPAILTYVNGGFTQAHFTSASMVETHGGAITPFSTPATTFKGWFFGGGAEAQFAPGWLWRTEYRYADYGTTTLTDTAPGGANIAIPGLGGTFANPQSNITFHPIVQTIRSGVVFKFGWPG